MKNVKMATEERWKLSEDVFLNVNTNTCDIIYHPNLNIILASTKSSEVLVIDVNSGEILQRSSLAGCKDGTLQGRYLPGTDKVLYTDGHRIGARRDYNGVLLLDTILQTPVVSPDDVVKLEILLSEAILLHQCLIRTECGAEQTKQVQAAISQGIKKAQEEQKTGTKAQKWKWICMDVSISALKPVCLGLLGELKLKNRPTPVVSIASSINHRLTRLLSGPDPDIDGFPSADRAVMFSEAARIESFTTWPHMSYKWALPWHMAQAGFYHEPNATGDDRAMCFTCNVCLVSWEPTDEPWSEHERHSPACPHVKGEFTQNVPLTASLATAPAVAADLTVLGTSADTELLMSASRAGHVVVWNLAAAIKIETEFDVVWSEIVSSSETLQVRSLQLQSHHDSESEPINGTLTVTGLCVVSSTTFVVAVASSWQNCLLVYEQMVKQPSTSWDDSDPVDLVPKLVQVILQPSRIVHLAPLADQLLLVLRKADGSGMLALHALCRTDKTIRLCEPTTSRSLSSTDLPVKLTMLPDPLAAAVCSDGTLHLLDLITLRTLATARPRDPGSNFVSATYCNSLEQLCGSTDKGCLQFFRLKDEVPTEVAISSVAERRTSSATDSTLLVNQSQLSAGDLRRLSQLTRQENLSPLFSANVPPSWTELHEAQKQRRHPQHLQLRAQHSRSWRLQNNTTSWNEHTLELILPRACTLAQVDVKFTLRTPCPDPPRLQVTLLRQSHAAFATTSVDQTVSFNLGKQGIETFPQDLNAEVLCGPINLASCLDLSDQSGTVVLTSPALMRCSARALLIYIRSDQVEIPTKPAQDEAASTSDSKKEASSSNKKSTDYYMGCDWLHEVSITVRKAKPTNLPHEKVQRCLMLESEDFADRLLTLATRTANPSTALDMLTWMAAVNLSRHRSVNPAVADGQAAFLRTVERRLPALLERCLLRAGRSLAHKCAKLVVVCSEGERNSLGGTSRLDERVLSSLTFLLPQLPGVESAGALHWFCLLLRRVMLRDGGATAAREALALLVRVGRQMDQRANPYHALLRTRFGLYKTPLESELFDVDPPVCAKSSSVPVTYASVLSTGTGNTVMTAADSANHGADLQDSLQLRDMLALPASSEPRSASPAHFLRGLLEVEPLHYSCHAASDGTKMEKLDTASVANFFDPSGFVATSNDAKLQDCEFVDLQTLKDFVAVKKVKSSVLIEFNKLSKASDSSSSSSSQQSTLSGPTPLPSGSTNQGASLPRHDAEPASLPWQRLLTDQTQHMLVIERMHSGARRFVVVDFGRPVVLTDVLIPACADLVSLSVDVWSRSEASDAQRLVVAADIGSRTLVMSDLQPPPVCRYLKITTIGRYGMSTTCCRIPIGCFFGHMLALGEEGAGVSLPAQLVALEALFQDVRCRQALAGARLQALLEPLRCETRREEGRPDPEALRVTAAYQECLVLQQQLNLVHHVMKRLQAALPDDIGSELVTTTLQQCCSDKLRVLCEALLDILLCHVFQPGQGVDSGLGLDRSACGELFSSLCVWQDSRVQLAACSILARSCALEPWWGGFLADTLATLSTAKSATLFPRDRVFMLVAYLGRRSLAAGVPRARLLDCVLQTLTRLLEPPTNHDLPLVGWILLFLNLCLDTGLPGSAASEQGSRWDFVQGELAMMNKRLAAGGKSGPTRGYRRKLQKRLMHHKQQLEDLETAKKAFHASTQALSALSSQAANLSSKLEAALKQHEHVFKKTIKQHSVKHLKDVLKPPKREPANEKPAVRTEPRDWGVDCVGVARALLGLVLRIDPTLHSDMFLLACKVLARISRLSRLTRLADGTQLQGLVRLATGRAHVTSPVTCHAITCLLQDLTDQGDDSVGQPSPAATTAESDDSELDDFLDDILERGRSLLKRGASGSGSISVSTGLDARLEYGVEGGAEVLLKRLIGQGACNLSLGIASPLAPPSLQNSPDSHENSPEHKTVSQDQDGETMATMLTSCFDSVFSEIHLPTSASRLDLTLQLYLTLNSPSCRLPLSAPAVSGLLSALATQPDVPLRSWYLAFSCLSASTLCPRVSVDQNYVPAVVRFLSLSDATHVGPSLCSALADVLTAADDSAGLVMMVEAMTKLGGPLAVRTGPLDAQCRLVEVLRGAKKEPVGDDLADRIAVIVYEHCLGSEVRPKPPASSVPAAPSPASRDTLLVGLLDLAAECPTMSTRRATVLRLLAALNAWTEEESSLGSALHRTLMKLSAQPVLLGALELLTQTEMSEAMSRFLLATLDSVPAVEAWVQHGGADLLATRIVECGAKSSGGARAVSSMMRHLSETDAEPKIDGLSNFAPLCSVSSTAAPAEVLLQAQPPHRRARTPPWSHRFYADEAYVELLLRLPCAVMLHQVQLVPHLAALATCPARVAVEVARDCTLVPLCAAADTAGQTLLRLQLPQPELACAVLLRLYRPRDCANMGLAQVKLLGVPTACATNTKTSLATNISLRWLALLQRCLLVSAPIPHLSSAMSSATEQAPGLLEACADLPASSAEAVLLCLARQAPPERLALLLERRVSAALVSAVCEETERLKALLGWLCDTPRPGAEYLRSAAAAMWRAQLVVSNQEFARLLALSQPGPACELDVKLAADLCLCSVCRVRPELFQRLLDSAVKCLDTGGDLGCLVTLATACQSPPNVTHLLDSGLPARISRMILEQTQEDLEDVTLLLDFLTQLTLDGRMRDWMGTEEASVFWHPLLSRLSRTECLLPDTGRSALETSVVTFLSRCCSCHPANQTLLSAALCDVIGGQRRGMSGFARRLVLQLLLESERVIVCVRGDVTPGDSAACGAHPSYGARHEHRLLRVPVHSTGADIVQLVTGIVEEPMDKRTKEAKNVSSMSAEAKPSAPAPSATRYTIHHSCGLEVSSMSLSQLLQYIVDQGGSISSPSIELSLVQSTPNAPRAETPTVYEALPTALQVFSQHGGLALLALHLPTVYPETWRYPPADKPNESQLDAEWVKVEAGGNDIYDDVDDAPAYISSPGGSRTAPSLPPVPPHALAAFALFLRLPGYAGVLLREHRRRAAQCLLRLVLGVADSGEDGNVFALSELHTLSFQALCQLYDSLAWDSTEAIALRQASIDTGAVHLLLRCLSVFTHQPDALNGETTLNSCADEYEDPESKAEDEEAWPLDDAKHEGEEKEEKDKAHLYWAKGTGFGTGSTAQSWNMEQALMRQRGEEEQVTVLLQALGCYMNPRGGEVTTSVALPPAFSRLLQHSCVLPAARGYLRNDSVLDMAQHVPLYRALFRLLRSIARHPDLVPMLRGGEAVVGLLARMRGYVDTYASRLGGRLGGEEGEGEADLAMFIRDMQRTAKLVQAASADHAPVPDVGAVPAAPDCSSLEQRYLCAMRRLQFDSCEMIAESTGGFQFAVSYHFESNLRAAGQQRHPARVKRLAQEAVTLSSSLPLSFSSSVFVRCDTDRLDLMKVLITGPAETPYANGCFEFDVFFPPEYPTSPMLINLQTTGHQTIRFNPNLYNDGKVCLSVLNTWHGRPEEKWSAHTSSLLQVLVSIQSLILVPEPYFNEPGYERSRGTPSGTQSSREYNSNICQATVKWAMLEQLRNPCPCFRQVINTHFWMKRAEICAQIETWITDLETQSTDRRTARSISLNAMALKRNFRQLREEMGKLKVPEGLSEADDFASTSDSQPVSSNSSNPTESLPADTTSNVIPPAIIPAHSNDLPLTSEATTNHSPPTEELTGIEDVMMEVDNIFHPFNDTMQPAEIFPEVDEIFPESSEFTAAGQNFLDIVLQMEVDKLINSKAYD